MTASATTAGSRLFPYEEDTKKERSSSPLPAEGGAAAMKISIPVQLQLVADGNTLPVQKRDLRLQPALSLYGVRIHRLDPEASLLVQSKCLRTGMTVTIAIAGR
jgi:hypothetical protein